MGSQCIHGGWLSTNQAAAKVNTVLFGRIPGAPTNEPEPLPGVEALLRFHSESAGSSDGRYSLMAKRPSKGCEQPDRSTTLPPLRQANGQTVSGDKGFDAPPKR